MASRDFLFKQYRKYAIKYLYKNQGDNNMKKLILVVLLTAAACISGCTGEEQDSADKAGESTTEQVDQAANEAKEALGDSVTLPSESVVKVMADTWYVAGSDDVYVMKEDGTGTKNGEPFTFECGFDDENHITLHIVMTDTEEEELYALSTDTTGYGVNLTSLDGGDDLLLLPADITLLDLSDERASAIPGKWSDGNGNTYTFKDDNTMVIDDSETETKGTYSVAENSEGTSLLKIVVEGGALEFEYNLNTDGTEMDLQSPGTTTVHHWTKE